LRPSFAPTVPDVASRSRQHDPATPSLCLSPTARGSAVMAHYGLSCAIIRKPHRREGRLAHLNLASRRLNDQRDARHAGFADVGLYGGGVQDVTQFVGLWSLEVERLRGAEPR
jgi:hypothetical protein